MQVFESGPMGPAEMKYRYECKVEKMQEEVAVLSDLIRDEVGRLEQRFAFTDKAILKIETE